MNREQIVEEIARVEAVLRTTDSRKLRSDYGKYLKRLYKDLKYYDKAMTRFKRNNSACASANNLN